MSAQVTEAHRELARRIMFEFTQAGTATASDVRMAAQIIADSEAKAVQSAQDIKSEWAYATMNERNQLRAERDYNHECINRLATATGTLGEKSERVVEVAISTIDQLRTEIDRLHAINAMRESAIARAERAEADADSTRERALTLANSLDGAQAELAAERKKVKTLHKALGDVKNSICRNVPDGYSQPCVDESADECDRIIDAAMKEGKA